MSQKKPKTYHVEDMWNAYSSLLLKQNPEWFGVLKRCNPIRNYYLYRKYEDENGKKQVITCFSYPLFRDIIEGFFIEAKRRVIAGERITLTNRLGTIYAIRVERIHTNKKVNFAKTKLYPMVWSNAKQKMVREKVVYFIDDDYCRISWDKENCAVPGANFYEFEPTNSTSSGTGFKEEFSKTLKENSTLKLKYRYYPRLNNKE